MENLIDVAQLAAGAIVSIVLSLLPLIPSLDETWAGLNDAQKQAVNGAVLFVVAGVLYLLACNGVANLPCDSSVWGALISAVAGNQLTFNTVGKLTKTAAGGVARKVY